MGRDLGASVKRDGAAFHAVIGADGYARFISRRLGVGGDYPDKTDRIPHLAAIKFPDKYIGNVINTELVHTGQNSDGPDSHRVVSGILNSLGPRAASTQKLIGPIRAIMLDVQKPELSTYRDKLDYLKEIEQAINKPDILSTIEVHPQSEIDNLVRKTRDQKAEGVIVTSLTMPEMDNTRWKIKHRISHNLKISRILQEEDISGKLKPSMGSVEVSDSRGVPVANVGSGWSRAEREEAWQYPSRYLGRLISVESMGIAKDRLRAPVYAGDADGEIDDASEHSWFDASLG